MALKLYIFKILTHTIKSITYAKYILSILLLLLIIMQLTLKPYGFFKYKSYNECAYTIIKNLINLDKTFKSFVYETYNRTNLRGLNNSYKTLKSILNNKRTQILQKLYKLKPTMKTSSSQNKQKRTPKERLNNILTHINNLPDKYFDVPIFLPVLDDTVVNKEFYKEFSDTIDLYEERQREHNKLLKDYQYICKINGLEKPLDLPIKTQFHTGHRPPVFLPGVNGEY